MNKHLLSILVLCALPMFGGECERSRQNGNGTPNILESGRFEPPKDLREAVRLQLMLESTRANLAIEHERAVVLNKNLDAIRWVGLLVTGAGAALAILGILLWKKLIGPGVLIALGGLGLLLFPLLAVEAIKIAGPWAGAALVVLIVVVLGCAVVWLVRNWILHQSDRLKAKGEYRAAAALLVAARPLKHRSSASRKVALRRMRM